MKTIPLTPQQRKDISERRRQAQDRRIYQRLSAVLWSDDGRTREEIAELVGVSTRQVGQGLRIFRNKGLDELGTLHYQGDPGRLGPAQVKRLKQEIETGVFPNADQIRTWIETIFGVTSSASGVKDLLRRIGASFHKVSGFFWKADVKKQKQFVRKYRRHKRQAGLKTRRYFVDACHPVWGVDLLYSCGLLVGQRFYVGVGNGRKRLNILGASSPDDHDSVDLRLTKENITGEQFAVRQAAGDVAGQASRDREVPAVPGQCEVRQQAVREAVAGGTSPVPVGVSPGLFAEPEADRAAVEIPEEEGIPTLAQDVRGVAECGGGSAGSTGRVSG
jgi:transposase